jgi:hypothetical protein
LEQLIVLSQLVTSASQLLCIDCCCGIERIYCYCGTVFCPVGEHCGWGVLLVICWLLDPDIDGALLVVGLLLTLLIVVIVVQ